MVELGSLILETIAAGHLEAEEGAHWLFRGVGVLLPLFLLGWGSGSSSHGGRSGVSWSSSLFRGRLCLDYSE